MKPTNLILAFSIFFLTKSFAQDSQIQWGPASKFGDVQQSSIPLGWKDNHFYTVLVDNKSGFLLDLNKDLDVTKQTPLIVDWKKFDVDLMFLQNSEIKAITSEYSKEDKATMVYGSKFTLDGKITNINREVVLKVPVAKKGESSDIKYYFSEDTSTLLIVHEHDLSNDANAKITFSIIKTKDLSVVYTAAVDFPYQDKMFALLTASVENDGRVILLSTIKGDEGKRLEKYSDKVFIFPPKSKVFTERDLKIEGKFISSARTKIIDHKYLMVTGFFNDLKESGKNEGVQGAFIAKVEIGKPDQLSIKTKDIDATTKAAITHTGGLSSMFQTDEMNAYFLRVINVNTDGSGYVIAEQRIVVERQEANSVSRAYYFNHLVLYRFNINQEIQWISTIPKIQVSSISTPKIGIGPFAFWYFPGWMVRYCYKYNSFISMDNDGGDIFLLYNDHKDNGDARTIKDVKTMGNKNKALATLLKIDYNGKWTKEQLFRGKDLDVILDPAGCYGDKNELTISAEKGKTL